MTQAQTKTSALDALRGLAKKAAPPSAAIAAQVNDPAIAGAKRDKNTVKLGFDPSIAETAAHCAALKEALERAESEFKVDQSAMRDYGIGKRGLYNDTYKCEVTTVSVPYTAEVPGGHETRYVQVICSNKYSVNKDIILGNRDVFGGSFDRLFRVDTTKSLKPNAEELIRNLLTEVAGISGDELEQTMEQLFDTTEKVSVTETFERESKNLPTEVRMIIDQSVTKAAPALKFP